MSQRILGVDYGGVICNTVCDAEGTYQPLPGAFETLRLLNAEAFRDNVFIVSRADVAQEDRTLWWLWLRNFYEKTGIRFENLENGLQKFHFCRERSQKAEICAKLGITHFVDDRLEVLMCLYEVGIPNLYLFGKRDDEAHLDRFTPLVTQVNSWDELAKILL